MSYFIERNQLSCPDNIDRHFANVYNHLFPHSQWNNLPPFSLDGILRCFPPFILNAEYLGNKYTKWKKSQKIPFVTRIELPDRICKLGMKLYLTDTILEPTNFEPKKSDLFTPYMENGDRFGGVALGVMGILKPQYYFLTEPPGVRCFDVKYINCLGVENNNKPKAIIYFFIT